MKINEIHEEGKISLFCLITRADQAKTQKNTPFLSLSLQDDTGILDAKFWNLTEEMVKKYKVGDVVEAKGDIIFHRNAIQLRVRHLEIQEDADITKYVPQAPMAKEDMEKKVDELIEKIQNPIIYEITKEILDQNRTAFFSYPAAVKNHHNFVGGLAYHSISMANIGQMLLEQYPWLDYDLLIAGILLHDIGKIEEYTKPVLPEYSSVGNLVGHISLAAQYIDRVAVLLDAVNSEEVYLLKHMVLSHHGKMEYGSPVLPMIPEAEMLSLIDNMDSRMYMMKESIENTKPGSFGPRIFALENRMIYHRTHFNENETQEIQKAKEENEE